MQDTTTEEELRERLKAYHIDLYLRRNDTGRITGVTFIDHQTRCVMNGSRLGKAYSANALNKRFDSGKNRQQKPDVTEISDSSKRKGKQYMLR